MRGSEGLPASGVELVSRRCGLTAKCGVSRAAGGPRRLKARGAVEELETVQGAVKKKEEEEVCEWERLGTPRGYLSPQAASWVRIPRATFSVTSPCGAETAQGVRIVGGVTVTRATIDPRTPNRRSEKRGSTRVTGGGDGSWDPREVETVPRVHHVLT